MDRSCLQLAPVDPLQRPVEKKSAETMNNVEDSAQFFPTNFNNHEDDQENDDADDPYESPLLSFDDNGFPSEKNVNVIEQDDGDEDSFASDFYRSGSDFSALVQPSSEKKILKQKDLFQIWGLKKKPLLNDVNVNLKQRDLFQIWGLKKNDTDTPPNKRGKVDNVRGFGSTIDSGNGKSKASHARNWNYGSSEKPPRACPFYKKLPGTPFTVDAFRYGHIEGCSAYFLTHFHADHYGGLTKGWSHGPIYCTPITARLVEICLYVNPSFIHPLELDIEYVIEGIRVTMLEANHCPGAALVHFSLRNGQCYLHTGDFRACKTMQSYSLLMNHRVNVLYLDTTYCSPKYNFPSKDDVLSFVVKVTTNWLKEQPKTLVIVGAYSIGKECVYLAISKALGLKVFANASRRRILQSFGWPELSGNLCSHGKETPLHVMPISHLRIETLDDYLKTYDGQYKAVLAFRPTGWTYSETIGNQLDLIKPRSKGNVTIYGVPYSEHSSFTEMRDFVQFLKPDKIIPTVNVGTAASRDKMQSNFREWQKG